MADYSTIVPNPLSDYATTSYALTLYTVDKELFKKVARDKATMNHMPFKIDGDNKKVIIAESAVTSIQITNLTINTIPLNTQGTIATTVNMDITQTRGTGLIDKLYAISNICNWHNPYEMNYLLEIRFIGSTDTNYHNPTVDIVTLPIIITNINTNLSHHATVYNIEAVYSHAVTNDYSYSRVPENMTISSGNNLTDFFNNFASKMNDVEMNNVDYINFQRPAFVHEFKELPKEFDNWQIGEPTTNTTSRRNQTLYAYSPNTNEVTVSSNSTIQAFIDEVLRYTPDIQSLVVDNDNVITTYVVEPRIIVRDFDESSGKETYTIEWSIRPAKRKKYTVNDDQDAKYEDDALSALRTVKLYDYYHTGLNSEVREANFTINTLYHAKITQYQNLVQQNPNVTLAQQLGNLNTIVNSRKSDSLEYEDQIREDDYGNLILYAEDIDDKNPKYYIYEPKVKYNNADGNNSSVSTDANKALQYKEDVDFIRNATEFSFINCELKIKGDPYWILPPTNFLDGKNNMTEITTRDMSRENAVLVRFNYPTNDYYDVNNNPVESDANLFTAFYYIRAVSSSFQNGKFEQTLQGFRETKISLQRIKKYLIEKNII